MSQAKRAAEMRRLSPHCFDSNGRIIPERAAEAWCTWVKARPAPMERQMDEVKLEPCRCQSMRLIAVSDDGPWQIKCRDCGRRGPYANTLDTAKQFWNTRAALAGGGDEGLREALKPFADRLGELEQEAHEALQVGGYVPLDDDNSVLIPVPWLHKARAAWRKGNEGGT